MGLQGIGADNRADIVVTSLGSDEAVEEVYGELFGGQEVCSLPSASLPSLPFLLAFLTEPCLSVISSVFFVEPGKKGNIE